MSDAELAAEAWRRERCAACDGIRSAPIHHQDAALPGTFHPFVAAADRGASGRGTWKA